MGNIASTFGDLGRQAKAWAMFDKTLSFLRRVLPAGHPDIGAGSLAIDARVIVMCATGIALLNVSEGSAHSGDLPKAEASACEALSIFQAALLPSHPIVAAAEKLVDSARKALL